MTVAAVIQARMGSTRLPGKVLQPLAGKPILWHVVHRLRKCTRVDLIAIATSTGRGDDPIERFARAEGVSVIRGPEDDVLARFALAADVLDADVILRVTGDAPLVDPEIADQLIAALQEADGDYATFAPAGVAIDEGFDPFSRRALDRLCEVAADDPTAREHITAYFKDHPDFVRVVTIPPPSERAFDARISVDTPADLQFLEAVHIELAAAPGDIDVEQVVALLRQRPDLLEINRHVHQKGADEVGLAVLIRCDGEPELGLGHVVRCLALADVLRDRQGAAVRFAVGGALAAEIIARSGYPTDAMSEGEDENEWLLNLVDRYGADVLVLDVRTNLAVSTLERAQAHGCLVAVIDDPSDRRLAADLGFYPPTPQVFDLDWSELRGTLHAGWNWVPLRSQFSARRHLDWTAEREGPAKVLIAMGGADPGGLSARVLDALTPLGSKIELHLAVGSANPKMLALKDRTDASDGQIIFHHDVENMADLMAGMDIAVAAFGITAYELAALWVPAVHLCLTSDHAIGADALEETGAAVSLGTHTDVSNEAIRSAVDRLIDDPERCAQMAAAGLALGLGEGARNVAQEIINVVSADKNPA